MKTAIVAAAIAAIPLVGCGPEKSPIGAGPTAEEGNNAVAGSGAGAMPNVPSTPPPPTEFVTTEAGQKELHALGIAFPVGENWISAPPANAMRIAQFTLPAPAKPGANAAPEAANQAESGELVIFYFGPGQGGSVEENIARWIEQVTDRVEQTAMSHTINGLSVHQVIALGTLQSGGMGSAPAEAKPGSMLFGLIVEGSPWGTVFAKATGPAETMVAHLDSLDFMMKNLRPYVPAAQTQAAPSASTATFDGPRVTVGGLTFTAGETWQPLPPDDMRQARFSIALGTDAIEVGISHFGVRGGGSANDNISRWLAQVPDRGDTVKTLTHEVGGRHIIFVQATGTVTTSADAKPNHTLFAAMIENGPEGAVFVKAVGPANAVADALADLMQFVTRAVPANR